MSCLCAYPPFLVHGTKQVNLTMPLPDRQREKGEEQVRKIVEAGITTFVCLQVQVHAQSYKP